MVRALPLVLPIVLAACATTAPDKETAKLGPSAETKAARQAIAKEDILTQMTFWAKEYAGAPNDVEAARAFAEILRFGARPDRAAEVALEALNKFPGDAALTFTLGLSNLEAQRPQDALRPLAVIAQAEQQNWRARTALGAALDQLGRYEEARLAYKEALAIKADCVPALTNMGVSYLMSGDPETAESVLKQAAALPDAAPETRANLAIAIALQGRWAEAEKLQSIDLPPQMVAANMAYLQGFHGQSHRWDQLNDGRKAKPTATQ
jgi:Flp pilus assembly protein TadD